MHRSVLLIAGLSVALATAASAATSTYTARLTGSHEVPKTESKGAGKLAATFDTNTKELKYTLTFDHLSGPATAAHFHGPADMKTNAGVIAPIGDKNPSSPISGTVSLTDDQAKALEAGKLYANVHTAADPGGEIRGQILPRHAKKTAATKTAPPAAATPSSSVK
jgi:hypothetical protein